MFKLIHIEISARNLRNQNSHVLLERTPSTEHIDVYACAANFADKIQSACGAKLTFCHSYFPCLKYCVSKNIIIRFLK